MLEPTNARILSGLGDLNYYCGDADGAIGYYGEALRLDPRLEDAYFGRAAAFLLKKQYDLAIADYSTVLRTYPADGGAHTYSARGWAFALKGEHDKARADYDTALAVDPDNIEAGFPALVNRGILSLMKEDLDAALADFNEAVRMDPDSVYARIFRGDTALHLGQLDEAFADGDKVLALDPGNPAGYLLRACVHLARRNYEKSAADFTESIRLGSRSTGEQRIKVIRPGGKGSYSVRVNPQDQTITALQGRANASYHLGEYDKAIADLTEVLRADPSNPKAYQGRGLAHAGREQFAEAVADFTHLIRLTPASADAYYCRGRTFEQKKDYASALADYEAACRADPNDAYAWGNAALLLAKCPEPRLRDLRKAEEYAKRAADASGWWNRHGLRALAAVVAARGEYPLAVQWLRRAMASTDWASEEEKASTRNDLDDYQKRVVPLSPAK